MRSPVEEGHPGEAEYRQAVTPVLFFEREVVLGNFEFGQVARRITVVRIARVAR